MRGILTDGFDSTPRNLRTLFPGARLGNCLRHALLKLPKKLTAIASPVRKALRSQFHTLLYRARQRPGLRVFALGQRLRHFADDVVYKAGMANGKRVRRWFHEKKAGWYAVLADPQMPVMLDRYHIIVERDLREGLAKVFSLKNVPSKIERTERNPASLSIQKPTQFGTGVEGDGFRIRHPAVANGLFDLRRGHRYHLDHFVVIRGGGMRGKTSGRKQCCTSLQNPGAGCNCPKSCHSVAL